MGIPVTLDRCRYLQLALTMQSATGQNTCVQRAAALMLDMPADAALVFGVVRAGTAAEQAKDPRASPVPFVHAWVEYDGQLYAPTLVEKLNGLHPIPVDVYYRANGVTRTWRLENAGFMQVARRWKLAASLKHGSRRAGRGVVADAFLQAAGVQYVLSSRNTILPA